MYETKKIIEKLNTKDNVEKCDINGEIYYTKEDELDTKEGQVFIKNFFYFELLKSCGIAVPEITLKIQDDKVCLFSKEIKGTNPGVQKEFTLDTKYINNFAKMVFIADILGLSDIAIDNVIVQDGTLHLIDFEEAKGFIPINNIINESNYNIQESIYTQIAKNVMNMSNYMKAYNNNPDLEKNITLSEKDKMQIVQNISNALKPENIANITNKLVKYDNNIIVQQMRQDFAKKLNERGCECQQFMVQKLEFADNEFSHNKALTSRGTETSRSNSPQK